MIMLCPLAAGCYLVAWPPFLPFTTACNRCSGIGERRSPHSRKAQRASHSCDGKRVRLDRRVVDLLRSEEPPA